MIAPKFRVRRDDDTASVVETFQEMLQSLGVLVEVDFDEDGCDVTIIPTHLKAEGKV